MPRRPGVGLVLGDWCIGRGQPSQAELLDRLKKLEENQTKLYELLKEKDARLDALQAEVERTKGTEGTVPPSTAGQQAEPSGEGMPASAPSKEQGALSTTTATAAPAAPSETVDEGPFGSYRQGRGFGFARTEWGEVNFGIYTYVRYLNQKGLDDHYTNGLGEEVDARPARGRRAQQGQARVPRLADRPALQLHPLHLDQQRRAGAGRAGRRRRKPQLGLQSGAHDRRRHLVVADDALDVRQLSLLAHRRSSHDRRRVLSRIVRAGVLRLRCATRLRLLRDAREQPEHARRRCRADGCRLHDVLGALWWMPTTGEYGPRQGFGDYEDHQNVATRLGGHFTFSPEDRQSQPGSEDIDNTQIRLSNGTIIFTPGALAPDVAVRQRQVLHGRLRRRREVARHGARGRVLRPLAAGLPGRGPLPVHRMFDHGFQVLASAMVLPKTVQAYSMGSYIFGDFGDSWEMTAGINWWVFRRREMRLNFEYLYDHQSPIGYTAVPQQVGGTGSVLTANLEMSF